MSKNVLISFLIMFFLCFSNSFDIYCVEKKRDSMIVYHDSVAFRFESGKLEISDNDFNILIKQIKKSKKYLIHSFACMEDKGTLLNRFTLAQKRAEKIKQRLLNNGFLNENLTAIVFGERGKCVTTVSEKVWEPKLKIELEKKNNKIRLYLINLGEKLLINKRFSLVPYPELKFEILNKEGKKYHLSVSISEDLLREQDIILLKRGDVVGREFPIYMLAIDHALGLGSYKARAIYENTFWEDKGVYNGRLISNWVSFEVTKDDMLEFERDTYQ